MQVGRNRREMNLDWSCVNMKIKGMILCEGETDQVLIGYYLKSISGWKFSKKEKEVPFTEAPVYWYRNAKEELLGIWNVGGNNFNSAVEEIFSLEILEHSIERIVIITDNDDSDVFKCRINPLYLNICKKINIKNDLYNPKEMLNRWGKICFKNDFGKVNIDICFILVPLDEHGALETFMLNSLANNDEDKRDVVSQSKDFILKLKSKKYLIHRREKIKAELGVSIAVFSPDKVFTTMNELIESVDWKEYSKFNNQFELLKEL